MKKTGLLILLVVLTLCMVAFAACGNKADPKQNDDPSDEQVHTHTFGELIAEVAATCEADGTKAHKHCSGCNKDFDADGKELTDLVIPKLGHKLEEVAEAPATCGAEGTKAHKKCATCGKLFDAEGKEVTAESLKIEKLTEHTIVEKAEEPQTCAKEGVKAHKECTVCGKLFDLNGNETTAEALAIAKDEHDLGDLVAEVPAGYGVDGVAAHYQCSFCKTYFDKNKKEIAEADLVIPALKTSEGLEFTSNGDGTCAVTGIGECTDTDVVIPAVSPAGDKVVEISDDAFLECKSITSITVPGSVTAIGIAAFAGCDSLQTMIVADDNKTYYSAGNCIIDQDNKALVAGCVGSVIPTDGTVTKIGDCAFLECLALKKIFIPGCIEEIGDNAFGLCTALEEIDFVGLEADWDNITKASTWNKETPAVVKTAEDGVYSQGLSFDPVTGTVSKGSCTDKILVIPESYKPDPNEAGTITIKKIDAKAFMNLTDTFTVIIPATVTEIGKSAFEDCRNLKKIIFFGTDLQWKNIEKGEDWKKNSNIGNDDIDCIEGHGGLTHHAAVDATTTAAGNIEYWYCEACGKYFSDAAGTTEITEADTVIPKKQLATG